MRILFQGDSITDGSWKRNDGGPLGHGYPKFAAEKLHESFPGKEFVFINRGISGNRTHELLERSQEDIVNIKPDVVSVLIGVNDVWRHFDSDDYTSEEKFASNYTAIFQRIKETGAKIIIMEPFYIGCAEPVFRKELDEKINIVRQLAYKYADSFVPLDGLISAAVVEHGVEYLTRDGIHPNQNGHRIIADHYVKAFLGLVPNTNMEK